jgi:RNA polymerase sigma-54 factor
MRAALQLAIGQQLKLTPQLQQAIGLLQLSTLDLHQEVQQAVEKNPLLEIDKPALSDPCPAHASASASAAAIVNPDLTRQYDVYPMTSHHTLATHNDLERFTPAPTSLQTHLRWQLNLTPMSNPDRDIANAVIDAIDDRGTLTLSLRDIQAGIRRERRHETATLAEIRAVLHLIQRFDPIGVGAASLQECLLIQLQQLPTQTPHLDLAQRIVREHLNWLGQRNFAQLQHHYKISAPILQAVMRLIQSLHPHPGDQLSEPTTSYIIADVLVTLRGEQWQVELNPEVLPKLRINQTYANLIQNKHDKKDHHYLRRHLQEAQWFIKSLQNRHDTLLRVSTCVIANQVEFLVNGPEALKPLTLSQIAAELNLHESTISRVTSQKYVYTPRGIFELKYFFSSHIATANGGECSAKAIQAMIKKIISKENEQKPLSDQKISLILQSQGINIARRTIAKYREALHIPASNLRKCLSTPCGEH